MKVNAKIDYKGIYYYNKFIFNESSIKTLIDNLDKSNFWIKTNLNIGWKSVQEFKEYNLKPKDELEYLLNNKICPKCKIIKDISNFRIIKNKLNSFCKKCNNYKKPKLKKDIILLSSPNAKVFLDKTIYYSNRSGINDDIAVAIYLDNRSIEKIANDFNLDQYTVKILKNINKYENKDYLEKLYINNTTKKCSRCLEIKNNNEFYKKLHITNICLMCKSKKRYYLDKYNKHEKVIIRRNYKKSLFKNPEYRLRVNISKTISNALKKQKASKSGESIFKYLNYTFEDLKNHLEKQFDSNMNWENYGPFIQNKYTWNLDHIKCQSDYPYSSMNDDNFKIVWDLNNLRPLEAIKNSIEGSKKVRHLKK